MNRSGLVTESKLLAFAAVVELGTGLVLAVAPAFAVGLLLGSRLTSDGFPVCRVAGIALMALGLACWLGPKAGGGSPAFRGMLAYSALVALYLAHLGLFRQVRGRLLWPAVALHAVVALLLLWTWRRRPRAAAANS